MIRFSAHTLFLVIMVSWSCLRTATQLRKKKLFLFLHFLNQLVYSSLEYSQSIITGKPSRKLTQTTSPATETVIGHLFILFNTWKSTTKDMGLIWAFPYQGKCHTKVLCSRSHKVLIRMDGALSVTWDRDQHTFHQ